MGSNVLPTNSLQLISLGGKMLNGIIALGPTLKLSLVTAEQFQTDLTAFTMQNDAYNAQRSARQTASDAFQNEMGTVYNWLLGVSNTLASAWGTRWSTAWAQAGFTNYTTGIPSKTEDRLGLMLAIINFFTANPSYEVPSLNQTAAYGTTLRTAALNAQGAVAAATVTLNNIGDVWTAAYNALVKDMQDLIRNLTSVLSDDDARWLSFGLQMPSSITTPAQPQNLSAHLDNTGALIVQCDPVPVATRYRWRTLIVSVQSDYTLAASTPAPIGSLGSFLPGQSVQIIAQAVNGSLQGVASDPIVFTVPLPVAVEKKVQAPSTANAINAAVSSNGNGNGRRNHSAHAHAHTHSHAAAGELHPRMA